MACTLFAHDVGEVTGRWCTRMRAAMFEADTVLLAPGAWATDYLKEAAPALKHVAARERANRAGFARSAAGAERARAGLLSGAAAAKMTSCSARPWSSTASIAAPTRRRRRGIARRRRTCAARRGAPCASAAWAGIRPMSPDGAPMIGKSGEVLVAAGHSRNGWLLGAADRGDRHRVCVRRRNLPPLWAALSSR